MNIKENVTKQLNQIIGMKFEKQLGLLAVDAISVINERVDDSKAVDGKRFKKYSEKYKQEKKKSGRSTKPDLQFTGELLRSIKHDVDGNKVVINFPNRVHKKSKGNLNDIARKNDQTRPFFDLSKAEFNKLAEKHVYKPINELINGNV